MENGGLVGLQPNWSILDMVDSERVMKIAAGPYGFREQNTVRSLYHLNTKPAERYGSDEGA